MRCRQSLSRLLPVAMGIAHLLAWNVATTYAADSTPPTSAITSPSDLAYLRGSSVTISGTSSDEIAGSGVSLVQVSTDGGETWHSATDTSGNNSWATWQYSWSLPVDNQYTVMSRATDQATNVQATPASITVTVDNTLPLVSFAIPAVFHEINTAMPITTFTVTDLNPDVYGLNTSTSPPTQWYPTPPGSVYVTSEGDYTFHAWARDKAGNVSALGGATSGTVRVSLPHTLNIDLAGNGSGAVTYGSQVFNVDDQVTAYSFDSVTLQASPSEYSLFGGWSGICSNQIGDCNYSMPTVLAGGATQTATATFNFDSSHAVYVAPNYFSTILDAYQAPTTASGAEIRIFGTNFNETLTFDLGKNVILRGGDNQAHTSNSGGMTTVQGPMTIKSGMITADEITIL